MHYPSVLAGLVASRGLPPEPVATTALLHLLERSLAARQALSNLAARLCPGLPSELSWAEQVGDESDAARPDLVGTDARGARVILEAKFDAELTPAQRSRVYLDRLVSDAPALLLFVAPPSRLPALWPEVLAGPAAVASPPPPNPDDEKQSLLTQQVGTRVVALVTWSTLLSGLGASIGDPAERADLVQLEGLVSWHAEQAWLPLRPEDLDRRIGRQLDGLLGVVVDAGTRLGIGGIKISAGSGDRFTGRWATSGPGSTVWFGHWPQQWARYGMSPIWVQAKPQPGLTSPAIPDALEQVRRSRAGLWPAPDLSWATPLLIRPGSERAEITTQLVDTVRAVLHLLDAARTAPTPEASLPTASPAMPAAQPPE
jgi:hypothetical protein